jgi:hypothetical protein
LKKQIINITPIQTAKVFALLYFVMSISFVALMAISFAFTPGPRPPIGILFAMPFIYLVFGFIFTALGAWVYNLVAGWVGGIEYTSTE